MSTVVDPAGTFYRYSLAHSLLRRARVRGRRRAERRTDAMKRIVIDPLTRLEGHGRVEIFLDEAGEVANAYLIVPELRGFERFCVGRPAEEMPRITNRICGLCPEAHHLASTKALDALFQVEPPPTAKKLRELLHMAFFVARSRDPLLHPGGSRFLPRAGHAARRAQHPGGLQAARRRGDQADRRVPHAEQGRGSAARRQEDPPGGGSPRRLEPAAHRRGAAPIEATARANVELAVGFLELFDECVLRNREYLSLIVSEGFTDRTYSMGTVDAAGPPESLRRPDPGRRSRGRRNSSGSIPPTTSCTSSSGSSRGPT